MSQPACAFGAGIGAEPQKEVQVLRTHLAGEAAEAMLASIPALQAQCLVGSASSTDPATARTPAGFSGNAATSSSVPAPSGSRAAGSAGFRAEAQEARMRARQRAHAGQVHRRFMCKLLGSPGPGSNLEAAAAPSRAADAAAAAEAARAAAGPAVQGCGEDVGGDGGEYAAPRAVQEQALSVREQVQTLIEAATDANNLAQMYEGWSAWI